MTKLEKSYLELQKNCGIKVGDIVKIIRKAKSREMGWNNTWVYEMNEKVGKAGIVAYLDDYGICVNSDGYCARYPFFVLETIKTPIQYMPESEFYALCDKTFGKKIRIKKVVAAKPKIDAKLLKEIENKTKTPLYNMSKECQSLLKRNKELVEVFSGDFEWCKVALPPEKWSISQYRIPKKNHSKIKI